MKLQLVMKNYDIACAQYYSKLNLLPLPLTSWEFRKNFVNEAIQFRKIQANWTAKQDYLKQSQNENLEIIVTDKNFKIIFASENIIKINGYEAHEVLGKSPTMFQGEDTCADTKKRIKTALSTIKPFKELILNYRKNGEPYWCEIEAYPMFSKKGEFLNYIALERLAS
jgi:PAS domain S-box-containing protein